MALARAARYPPTGGVIEITQIHPFCDRNYLVGDTIAQQEQIKEIYVLAGRLLDRMGEVVAAPTRRQLSSAVAELRLNMRRVSAQRSPRFESLGVIGPATGSISGLVTDSSGSTVPGAHVMLTVPTTGLTRSSVTNEAGEYIIIVLGVANYDVRVEKQGFQGASARDVRLQTDQHKELDFHLIAADVETSVEVYPPRL